MFLHKYNSKLIKQVLICYHSHLVIHIPVVMTNRSRSSYPENIILSFWTIFLFSVKLKRLFSIFSHWVTPFNPRNTRWHTRRARVWNAMRSWFEYWWTRNWEFIKKRSTIPLIQDETFSEKKYLKGVGFDCFFLSIPWEKLNDDQSVEVEK
jgi:hypothetical protein